MISDERLRVAAEESYELYISTLLSRGDYEAPHTFSPEFEAKMEELINSIGKKPKRRVFKKVASFILAVFVCAGTWLAVDAEARSKAFGWVKEMAGDWIVFHYESNGEAQNISNKKNYIPIWIPEGYTEYSVDLETEIAVIVYVNKNGNMLKFEYAQKPEHAHWMINYSQTEQIPSFVNGNPAEVLVSLVPEHSNAIIWKDQDGTGFYISGYLSVENLIKMAESVEFVKK